MDNQIVGVVGDWERVVPPQMSISGYYVAGETLPKPYQPKMPFARVMFPKVRRCLIRKEASRMSRGTCLKDRIVIGSDGERYVLDGLTKQLKRVDEPKMQRAERVRDVVTFEF